MNMVKASKWSMPILLLALAMGCLFVFHKGFLSEFTVSGFCCHAEKFSVFTEAAMNECLSFNHLLSRA